MQYDYSRLRGKIKEVCGKQSKFAEMLSISESLLSQRLNNKSDFGQDEIMLAAHILGIKIEDIPSYFFRHNVENSKLKAG